MVVIARWNIYFLHGVVHVRGRYRLISQSFTITLMSLYRLVVIKNMSAIDAVTLIHMYMYLTGFHNLTFNPTSIAKINIFHQRPRF